MEKIVTCIPATRNIHTHKIITDNKLRKVAGYARVSTEKDEQVTSYEAQVEYYTNYINNHPNWEFVNVYADDGISATNTNHRDGFKQMVEDALDGMIELIVTKSISRFARNTVDSIATVRQLKAKGVEVYFEKENLWTFDSKSELILTILSSLAQEESRNISENVKWSKRKSIAKGVVTLPYGSFLGYKKGKDGRPEIVPEEAEIIVLIYRMFMQGYTTLKIAQVLTEKGIQTPMKKEQWHSSTVESILTNEKYKGEAILQKSFIEDFLTKKTKKNNGELPMYHVTNSHKPIIDPEEWDEVQKEIDRRKKLGRCYSGTSVFASKIVCGDCGGIYGRKLWHSTDKYRSFVWQCNDKYKGEHKCKTPTLKEDKIKERFVSVMNKILGNKDEIIENLRMAQEILDDGKIDDSISKMQAKIDAVTTDTKECILENQKGIISIAEFKERYKSNEDKYNKLSSKLAHFKEEKEMRISRSKHIDFLIDRINEEGILLDSFDKSLWVASLEKVIAYSDGRLLFKFYSGLEFEG